MARSGVRGNGRGGGQGSTIVRAVFGVLTDGEHHTPIDMRLYLPERWIKDPARCERAGVPEASRKKMSKSEHALDIVRRARARGSGSRGSASTAVMARSRAF